MSRSGYVDDCENNWELIKWRGAVASATHGKRGQAFLRELAVALDAMPEKRLIAGELQSEEGVCALGCVGVARGVDLGALDPTDYDYLARVFDIAAPLVRELEFVNDEAWADAPENRWRLVRAWVTSCLKAQA